jgi:hypothetical protein
MKYSLPVSLPCDDAGLSTKDLTPSSDAPASKHGLIRVIDESGEDYGYSAERFFILAVPHTLERVLKGISATRQPNPTLKPPSGASTSKSKRVGMPRRSRLSV